MASTDRTISERISRGSSEDDTGIQESGRKSTEGSESAKERRLKKYEKVGDGSMSAIEEQNDQIINEELLKLIMYRSQRKWYSTISIIAIFAMILALMMIFVALGKDISEGWKEVLLVLIGAFVGSWSKVIDFWFNNAEQDNTLLESAND
jgi:hypothetical protein